MAAAKLLNLIAVSTLAILAASFGATPVSAVSVDTVHLGARSHAHAALAKKRRSDKSKRCKPRPASSAPKPTTTKAPVAVTTKAAVSTSKAAPATTTTKASSGSGSGSGGSVGKGKASVAWSQDDDNALANIARAGIQGAFYDWAPYVTPAAKKLGFRPCPMLWSAKQLNQWNQLVKPGYADCAMGFNEPNEPTQANMDPSSAAQLWKQAIQPKKNEGYFLVSPAPTNAPSGKPWLQAFLKACDGCTIDAAAVHVYTTNAQAMIDYLTDIHNTFNKPVWVTEFACQDFSGGPQASMDQVWQFYKTVKPWMDNTPWIQYHFAFGSLFDMGNVNPANRMINPDGSLTDLGYYYFN